MTAEEIDDERVYFELHVRKDRWGDIYLTTFMQQDEFGPLLAMISEGGFVSCVDMPVCRDSNSEIPDWFLET